MMKTKPTYEELEKEVALLKSKDRSHTILDCSGIMFIELDTHGKLTLVNKKACEIFGYNKAEMLGKYWVENFIPNRVKKEIKTLLKKILSAEINVANPYENPILTKSGQERDIYWHNALLKDAEGNITGILSSGEDITERNRMCELLRKSEEKFKVIADYFCNWEYWIGEDGNFIYCSPSCKQITGYDPEDFYKNNLLHTQIIHPDDREMFLNHKHEKDNLGFRKPIDFRIIDKNKNIHWIGHVCQKVTDADGNSLGIRVGNRLITQYKKDEKHLKMLSSIIEQSSATILITDLGGKIEYVNEAFTRVTGYSFEEAIGQNPRMLNAGKSDYQKFVELWKTISRGETWKGEFINRRKNGELYYEKAIISPFYDEKGKIINYVGIKDDISIQKRAELSLLESRQILIKSEKKLTLLNKLNNEMLEIQDLKSTYQYITKVLHDYYPNTVILYNSIDLQRMETTLEAISGLSDSFFQKVLDFSMINPLDKKYKLYPAYLEMYRKNRLIEFEDGLVKFSAGEFPVPAAKWIDKLLAINKIYTIGILKGDTLFASIHFFTFNNQEIADIDFVETFVEQAGIILQVKHSDEALRNREKELKLTNATKDKLFSIIAHDLRSPFNAILGFSELLLENHDKYDYEKRERMIKSVLESTKKTYDLLDNLLTWSSAQSGIIKYTPDQIILEKIIRKAIEQTETNALQKEIHLSFAIADSIVVSADENMLNTVLRNLISNAIKFTRKNGKIEIVATQDKSKITISVKDSGVGIKKEILPQIFNRMDIETTRGTENEKGSGFGLILCKEFIDKHNGKIWVESEEGIGSTFSFSIPKKMRG